MKMSDSAGEPAVGVGVGVPNGQVIRLLTGNAYGIATCTSDQEFTGSNQSLVQVNANLVSSNTMTRMVNVNSGSPGRVAVSRSNSGLGGTPGNNIASLLMTGNSNLPNLVTTLTSPVRQRTSSDVLLNSGRKRKLSDNGEDIASRRQRISEHKAARLKRIKERYVEHTSELFFLQAGGNVMELYAWRKRPPVPALVNFFKTNCLDPMDENEDLVSLLGPLSTAQQQPEMKIAGGAGASVTPVAVSTTLPAAVARLSQQGGMPLDPEVTVIGTSSVDKTASLSPNKINKSSPASRQHSISAVYDNSIGSQEQIVEKAKQEAHVMQRIGELQREGLWAEKRLPKVHEPPRAKAHWDYLIEEMVWLAADFAQERKWKKAAAKKCARMVQKYFQEKELMAQKAVKSRELQLKRIASCMAKEIKIFWANVEKIVEFKQQTRLEEKRKKALDQHLSFIVDQTEKYSTLVAESMNKIGGESVSHSVGSSRAASPSREHHLSDAEFEPGGTSSDDEETIAKAEAEEGETGAIDHAAEIEILKQESELPLEDLLKDYLDNREKIKIDSSPSSSIQGDDEYCAIDKDSSDDEETIQEQEKEEGEIDHGQELEDLKAEGEMSLDELMAKYGSQQNSIQTSEHDSDVEVEDIEDVCESENDGMEEDGEICESKNDHENENSEQETDLCTLLNDNSFPTQQPTKKEQTTDKEINDVAAIAQSIQPTGNTLSSTSVVTKIPFLLKHTLREYQHIGLDWLVTMHDRKLNGILADEMGLGKTIQTISVLAHLACEKGIWGPHLIIVPTSVMLNWEMEFKKWCPAFKILTYYGTQKERRLKRTGWTKPNAFHICITSYKLVIQDHQSFRRKKWKYLILDEAQNIKNFKSQRWQLLLNFQTQRRLLLTGTPLQNNLMELWSLMHFLMPNVFQSHREFKEWFSNPVTGMIEGNTEYNDQIIKRLHKVLRPFLLRRLKTEVEKQLPKKYEHIVMCRLSNRQRYLYDDFMSRARTRETLATGNLLSVINVLMQLRKVCNHPNLFEPRPTVSPFQMEAIEYHVASLIWSALDYDPDKHVDLSAINLRLIDLDMNLSAFTAHRMRKYRLHNKLIEEIDSTPSTFPRCPPGKIKIHVKFLKQPSVHSQVTLRSNIFSGTNNTKPTTAASPVPKVGSSPLIRTAILGQTQTQGLTLRVPCGTGPQTQVQSYSLQLVQHQGSVKAIPVSALGGPQPVSNSNEGSTPNIQRLCSAVTTGFAQLVQTTSGRHLLFTSSPQVLPGNPTVMTTSGQRLTVIGSGVQMSGGVTRLAPPGIAQIGGTRPVVRMPPLSATSSQVATQVVTTVASNTALTTSTVTMTMPVATVKTSSTVMQPVVSVALTSSSSTCAPNKSPSSVTTRAASKEAKKKIEEETAVNEFLVSHLEEKKKLQRRAKLCKIAEINTVRCTACPMYGTDLVTTLRLVDELPHDFDWTLDNWRCSGYIHCHHVHNDSVSLYWQQTRSLADTILSVKQRMEQLRSILARYTVCVPAVAAPRPRLHISHPPVWKLWQRKTFEARVHEEMSWRAACLHPIISAMSTQFPDPRLIQYDCGKLQSLDRLLRKLKSEHHRVLIFTQMTRMLDILEAFLNHHGHIYLRLDGTTRIDQRQVLMERFNADKRIFCFILSTRSGGIGVNLTGADTVIFYDSDWNPTMDAQAQDRCHRIGQTRDVHIYRLISEKTVEENILKKANQKRLLGDLAIEGGNFTTAYFKSSTIQELFNVDVNENDASRRMAEVLNRDVDKKQFSEEPQVGVSFNEEKTALGVLENALAAAEDETDVTAAKTAKAEAAAELAEFDESIPLEQEGDVPDDISKAEQEVNALIQQLSGVERYAMKFIEETEAAWSAEQLAAAEAEIEQQKREWEEERLAALQLEEEEEAQSAEEASEELLTFSREDSQNQVWVSQNGQELMPMWCPPTPPQDDSDVYIDHSLSFLYEQTTMSESQLPPVFIKKDRKRRMESSIDGRHPIKMRCHHRDETSLIHAPRSLFDRPSPALVKMRHDLRMQKYRGVSVLPIRTSLPSQLPGIKPLTPVKPAVESENIPEWLIHEDWIILQAMQSIQELTLNLVIVSPGHTPNWDMVADMVNMVSRIYRSPKQCRNRYESVIIPREEGKIVFETNIKKPKKTKGVYKLPQNKCNRPMKTSQLFVQDNNSAFTQLMNARFEAIRSISSRRTPTVKHSLDNTEMKNPKHAEVLIDSGIDYDNPLSPIDVASRRAERIAKEKSAAAQQLAIFRGQVGVTTAATAKPVIATSAIQNAATQQRPVATLTVQDMVSNQSSPRTSPAVTSSTSPQRVATATSQPATTTTAMTNKGMTTGKLNPAQLQMYQHRQAVLRQQQIKALQSRAVASGQKVSVAVTSGTTVTHQPARIQQVKQTGVTRTVSESEMAALIKRQTVAASSVSVGNKTGVGMSSAASLTPAQILAQAGLQAQQSGQVATLVKAVPAQTHIPVAGLTIPQVKAALGPGVKTSTMPQQIRQLTLQQQLMAQQRKLPAQKVTQLGQVMVTGKAGVPAQLIVQSQKAVPTTMTMQQIQQVIKHVHPQHITHVSTGGQTVVTQGGSGQVISHAVITKSQQPGGSTQTRVIPVATTQQNLKQTIQVVTGSPGIRTSVPNVTIDSSGRPNVSVASALAGAIKVGSPAQQQALLSQVSAALQQGQQIAVRQSPVRIQAAPSGTPLVAVAVSQAPTLLTLPQPPADTTQNQ